MTHIGLVRLKPLNLNPVRSSLVVCQAVHPPKPLISICVYIYIHVTTILRHSRAHGIMTYEPKLTLPSWRGLSVFVPRFGAQRGSRGFASAGPVRKLYVGWGMKPFQNLRSVKQALLFTALIRRRMPASLNMLSYYGPKRTSITFHTRPTRKIEYVCKQGHCGPSYAVYNQRIWLASTPKTRPL